MSKEQPNVKGPSIKKQNFEELNLEEKAIALVLQKEAERLRQMYSLQAVTLVTDIKHKDRNPNMATLAVTVTAQDAQSAPLTLARQIAHVMHVQPIGALAAKFMMDLRAMPMSGEFAEKFGDMEDGGE